MSKTISAWCSYYTALNSLLNINKTQIGARELLCFRHHESWLCWLESRVPVHRLLCCASFGLGMPPQTSWLRWLYDCYVFPLKWPWLIETIQIGALKISHAKLMWGAVQDSDLQQRDGAVWLGVVISSTGTAGTAADGCSHPWLAFVVTSLDYPNQTPSVLHFYSVKTLSSCFPKFTCSRS